MKLNELITKHNHNFSSYYLGELYTHTPMALIALNELGANSERLESFFVHDTKKLEAKKTSNFIIDENNWRSCLGDYSREDSFIEFFKALISRNGIEATIGQYFDHLMLGVGAAAFHPIIRLSYALRINNQEEVAISLGTWAASFLELESTSGIINDECSISEILSTLVQRDYNSKGRFKSKNIALRMLEVSKTSDYKDLVMRISQKSLKKENLSESLLWLYAQSDNFTLLHAVTSHYAFESVARFSKNEDISRVNFWKAVLAAFMSTRGVVKLNTDWEYPKVSGLPEWKDILAKAILSNDDHTIKLIHVLHLKNLENVDQKLIYAASLKLKMLHSMPR